MQVSKKIVSNIWLVMLGSYPLLDPLIFE